MGVPRAKRKKRTNVPSKPEQSRIMEANWLCMSVAIEQLYTDCGWRVKRINNLVNGFWEELTEAKRRQNTYGINHMPRHIAQEAGELIGIDIVEMTKDLDPYRAECYQLIVGCMIKTLRKLKVSKLRCKLIVGGVFMERRVYEPWSVYQECERMTGFKVRDKIQWE